MTTTSSIPTLETSSPAGSRVRLLVDSVAAGTGDRLASFEIRTHRFVLAEWNTHCLAARNSASSRAIPALKQLDRYRDDPAWPVSWPAEQPGMSGGDELTGDDLGRARTLFAKVHDDTYWAVADYLADVDAAGGVRLHKSVLNRLLEPLQWHTMLFTLSLPANNFFAQRAHPGAQPELRVCAEMMGELVEHSTPRELSEGDWHLPYLRPDEATADVDPRMVSAARCARTSFLGQNTTRPLEADVTLCTEKLIPSNHWSPFEHVATPSPDNVRVEELTNPDRPDKPIRARRAKIGKFPGWLQYRHILEAEHGWDSYR